MRIIELSVTLQDIAPPVTRVLQVPGDLKLDRLHLTLQAAFGWENAHLYQFCVGTPYQPEGARWVHPDMCDRPRDLPADGWTLDQARDIAGVDGLSYLYDFGDNWTHRIDVLQTIDPKDGDLFPRLTDITGTCPPEDIGGPPGYELFLGAMADPAHPEHRDLKDWYGGSFAPYRPNRAALRRAVRKLAAIWQKAG